MTASPTLYEEVVGVTEQYLGPAAQRFIDRQIEFHLGKRPADITKNDLGKLIEWVKVSLALLTDDKAMVEECTHKLTNL